MTKESLKDSSSVAVKFGDDVEFLNRYLQTIILENSTGKGKVAVSGALQGRVMTSTSDGDDGLSYGWINRKAFLSGDTSDHMNAFGGEDRFWLGPEGGQYSLYFEKGAPFEFAHWHVPRLIDLDPFDLVSHDKRHAVFTRKATLNNYTGTRFDFQIRRTIRIIEPEDALQLLGLPPKTGVPSMVAFESVNELTNDGQSAWTKDAGLLSIWILGMYNPSPQAVIIIPYSGNETKIENIVTDKYFGSVPADRLKMKGKTIFFKADGKHRSKIGLPPQHAPNLLGSYDAAQGVLTVVRYTKPTGAADYVNSLWEIQKDPYNGDAVNAYNDGPPEPGAEPMGPFFELETSSPAAALSSNETISHIHTTVHFHGRASELDPIMKELFGVTSEIVSEVF